MVRGVTVSREDRAFEIKRMIARCCESGQVKVNFMSNRRDSDVVMFALHGHRDQVLMLPAKIEEGLTGETLELINTRQTELNYLLHLVVTVDLGHQPTQTPERRSKLLTDHS
jgi:3-dehydroquinate synthase class II